MALTVKLLVVTNAQANRRDLERSTIEGESPVSESLERYQGVGTEVPRDTSNRRGKLGGPPSKAKYSS